MLIDLNKIRNKKHPYIFEEEVWDDLINLSEGQTLIIMKVNGELRINKVKSYRFVIEPEEL